MPVGPQGRKRPAGLFGCAVHVARIATGAIEESSQVRLRPNVGRLTDE